VIYQKTPLSGLKDKQGVEEGSSSRIEKVERSHPENSWVGNGDETAQVQAGV
jgi:hypothetical protein